MRTSTMSWLLAHPRRNISTIFGWSCSGFRSTVLLLTQFGVAELDFFGYRVDKCGVRPLDERVSTLRQFPRPSTPRKLREFLGLVNFYHRFIPGCAGILHPSHILFSSRKGEDHMLSWTAEADKAFVSIKEALANASSLYHPKPDTPTSIMTDASLTKLLGLFCSNASETHGIPLPTFPGS